MSDARHPGPTASAERATRPGRRPGQGDTREVIVEAARSLFSERGYDGTTMRLVAATAQVDPALIYHYFGSKQQLFVASMEIPSTGPRPSRRFWMARGTRSGSGSSGSCWVSGRTR